jgi:tRNA uridine 5-carboxymethylaminomethyl modification enzyme
LRSDNADQRLTDKAIALGCVSVSRETSWKGKKEALKRAREKVQNLFATPNNLVQAGLKVNQDGRKRSAFDLLRYPEIKWEMLEKIWPEMTDIDHAIREQVEIDALYAGYMARQMAEIEAFRKDEALKIPKVLDYAQIGGLSNEVRQKLDQVRPETLGAASRIPGVTPAAVIALLRHVKKRAA